MLRAVAKGLLRPAVVTPGGHRRFVAQDADRLQTPRRRDAPAAYLVGSAEAARLLGISQPTLNRAVREGRLRPASVTPGGHRRFEPSEIVLSQAPVAHGTAR